MSTLKVDEIIKLKIKIFHFFKILTMKKDFSNFISNKRDLSRKLRGMIVFQEIKIINILRKTQKLLLRI